MNLEKLKEQVKAQAEECKNLRDEKDRLVKEGADIVIKNISEILKPAVIQLNGLLKEFYSAAGCYTPQDFAKENVFIHKAENHEAGTFDLYLDFGATGVYPRLRLWTSSSYRTFSLAYDDFCSIYDSDAFKVFDWFGTEENTQEIVDKYLKESEDVFTAWQEYFTEANVALAKTVASIKTQLSGGSTVTQKEDGSVEIHLGGKTYKAVIKEENDD